MKISEWKEKLPGLLKNTKLLLVIGFAGIALIALSDFLPKAKAPAAVSTSTQGTDLSAEETVSSLEARLEKMLSSIDGAGDCKVMISLRDMGEYIYDKDVKQSEDSAKTYDSGSVASEKDTKSAETTGVIVDNAQNSGKQALLKSRTQPQISGVAVVCPGGGDIKVVDSIVRTITAVFGVPSNRVFVAQSK